MAVRYCFVLSFSFLIGLTRVEGSWERLPIVSQEIKDAGFAGGEGCQVIRDLKLLLNDPQATLPIHARCAC